MRLLPHFHLISVESQLNVAFADRMPALFRFDVEALLAKFLRRRNNRAMLDQVSVYLKLWLHQQVECGRLWFEPLFGWHYELGNEQARP